jgi:protein-tyrosine-phosphatase
LKFAVICNQNQARSQVLGAVLTEMFPDHCFQSFGIIAQENTLLPLVIHSVFMEWGLDPKGRVARNVGLHRDEIMGADVVIAMTTFISEEITNMGFRGEILDLELSATVLGVDLSDPQLMPRRQCAFELAKYVKVAYSALQAISCGRSPQSIKALMPMREASIGAALDLALTTMNENSVIIYGDLIAPRNDLVTERLGQGAKYRFRGSIVEINHIAAGHSDRIILPAHSVMWPSRMYFSRAWAGLFDQISAKSIILITPPQRDQSGMLAESYLAALYATEIQTIC